MTSTEACHVHIVPKLVSRVSGKGGWGLKCTAYSSISDLYINAMFLLAYFDLVVIIQFSPRKDRDPPLSYFPWSNFDILFNGDEIFAPVDPA